MLRIHPAPPSRKGRPPLLPADRPVRSMPVILALAVCILGSGPAAASLRRPDITEDHSRLADRIVRTALENEEGYRMLAELCSLGPRLSGSGAMDKAVEWVKARMDGLALDSVRLQPVMVSPWERSAVEEALLLDKEGAVMTPLRITALGGSVGTEASGMTGEILEVRSLEEFRRRAGEARSRIVFFNMPLDQGTPNTDLSYDDIVMARMNGPDAASEAGASAVLIRSLTTGRDDVPHTGVVKYSGRVRPIPAAALSWKAADDLSAALRSGTGRKIRMRLGCRRLPDRPSANVIGEIRGTEKPDEIIVVAGHLDSWDLGTGAHDDGGGCLQALEVLSLVRRLDLHPKRTIRCVLYADEEFLSRGAAAYAEAAEKSRETILAAVESDRGVFDPRGFSLTGSEDCLARIQSWLPLLGKAHIEWVRPGDGGTADVSWLKQARTVLGLLNESQRYMDLHHSGRDVYQEVNSHEMELGTAAITILSLMVSEEGLPGRGE